MNCIQYLPPLLVKEQWQRTSGGAFIFLFYDIPGLQNFGVLLFEYLVGGDTIEELLKDFILRLIYQLNIFHFRLPVWPAISQLPADDIQSLPLFDYPSSS